MRTVKWVVGLLAIAFFMGSCTTFDNSMATMKKTFPGRVDNTAPADNAPRK